ncbi:protein translocase subunit SecA-like [Perca fluviatilis]|uniref:protein translocase subunit SecA-like n=1 Tax=Perca fluviatilis TaxID=8168 RepID=UPI001965DB14|nr:protein translocase subunit SecA-like [Perca fluviatilis]
MEEVEELLNRLKTTLAHSYLTAKNNEEVLLNKLQGLVTNIKWSPVDAADLFDVLLKRFESTTTDRSHLLSWMLNVLHCIEINYITPSWRCQHGKTLIELVRDRTVTDEDLKKCLADDTEKQLDKILEEIRHQKLNQIDKKLLDDVRDIVSSVDKDLTSHNNGSQQSGLKKDLLRLCQAAEKTHFRPRLTQMVSWCIMALSKTGQLIEVGTGEGKSCIVAMFAAFRAMRGEKVDIMSSSSVLAERDLDEWRNFYKVLKISVSCNTNKQDKDSKECYKCQVVYGTVEEFAGDWLRHHFHRMDIFGERTFQCAIVDEVDSLMLDKGLHVVYISSDMPALQHLNPLLALIWSTVNKYTKIGTKTTVGQTYPFPHVVLEKMKGKDVDEFSILQMAEDTGLLAKGSVNDLKRNPSLLTEKTESVTADQLAKFFETVERRFPSCQFSLHCLNNDGAIEELNKGPQKETAERQRVPLLLINGGFCQYMYSDENSIQRAVQAEIEHALHFTPCQLSQDTFSCYVPGFLSEMVKFKLKVWIENALYAQTMRMDHEYIIERHGVVPVDYSCTGVVENNMKWTDGLHQFLEMKHGCKLSDMTAITNYMSNVGLLQKYGNQIFGISGTLGQQTETETLQKIYEGIKTCRIPSFKRRKLFEVEGVIVGDEKEWIEKICNVVTTKTNPTPYRAQRAVLVICETINRAKDLYHALGDKVRHKTLYISNNMNNTAIFAKKLEAGEVIIATNIAGRGTDLQVSDQVKRDGGLFVVQTFLPKNARVEAQAFGRTARQGSPGSAQLIICPSHLSKLLKLLALIGKHQSLLENIFNDMLAHQHFVVQFRLYKKHHSNELSKSLALKVLTKTSDLGIKTLKDARNDSVAQTLASYLECDFPKIKKKEELFSQYLNTLDKVYKSSNKPADSDLSALNEFWGMWLLTSFSENDSMMDLKNKLNEDLKTARDKLSKRQSPSSNLHHYTAFGNELREKRQLAESIEMYTKAIQEDHCWAAIAYYNRAFASLTQQDRHQDPNCIDQAREDLLNALKSVELYCEQIEVTRRYSTQVRDLHSDSVNRFDRHMKARQEVLLCFKGNITEAMKKVDRARDLGGNVKVEESLVYFLVPLMHFLPLAVLSIESLTTIRSRDPLKLLQLISHPSCDILNELRCLQSLGLTHVYTLDTLFSLGGFLSKIIRPIRRALFRWRSLRT